MTHKHCDRSVIRVVASDIGQGRVNYDNEPSPAAENQVNFRGHHLHIHSYIHTFIHSVLEYVDSDGYTKKEDHFCQSFTGNT